MIPLAVACHSADTTPLLVAESSSSIAAVATNSQQHNLSINQHSDRASKRQKGDDSSEHTSSTHSSSSSSPSSSDDEFGSTHSSTVVATMPLQVTAHVHATQDVKALISKKYRRVSFAPVTDIHSTEWTRDEVDSCWYSKEELSVFKQERKNLVKVLKRVQFDLSKVDTTQHCLRGYEAYFSIQANKEYKLKRQMVWEAVLQEQARQRYLGKSDAMMMQLVSSHATQWARDTATELGMMDAQVALQIFMEYLQDQEQQQQQQEEGEPEEQEQLEDYDDCDDEQEQQQPYTPSAFEEDLSLRPEQAAIMTDESLEPLQFSSQELNRTRLLDGSSTSHYSCSSMNSSMSSHYYGDYEPSVHTSKSASSGNNNHYIPQHLSGVDIRNNNDNITPS